MVESRFGIEVLYEEAIEELIPEAYKEAVGEHKLEPIDQPEIDMVEFESGKPFRFNAAVQLKPEVKLGEYKGVAVTKRTQRVVTIDDGRRDVEQYRKTRPNSSTPNATWLKR